MADKILLIEDEMRMRKVLELVLFSHGYDVATAPDGKSGIETWDRFQPDLVLTDLKMPERDGMAVLRFGRANFPDVPVIIFTAFGTIPKAVEAIKKGAFDYISKPVDNNVLIEKVRSALEMVQGRKNSLDHQQGNPLLIGDSQVMEKVGEDLFLAASTDSSILLTGASGTGKELAARTIHQFSARKKGPFIKINCAAIPGELLESELFGHARGAFTGAVRSQSGAFLNAAGGTLFLDEIGDLPLTLQPKLLHAVEDKVVVPLGSGSPSAVDVKIVSATNQNIGRMIEAKKFRADLYYRLNTYTVRMPDLSERKSDISLLVSHFLDGCCLDLGCSRPEISTSAYEALKAYAWPGNVRELKSMVERLVLVSRGGKVNLEMLTPLLQSPFSDAPAGTTAGAQNLTEQEKESIKTALVRSNWNISLAARQLGITRNTLRYRIKKHDIRPD